MWPRISESSMMLCLLCSLKVSKYCRVIYTLVTQTFQGPFNFLIQTIALLFKIKWLDIKINGCSAYVWNIVSNHFHIYKNQQVRRIASTTCSDVVFFSVQMWYLSVFLHSIIHLSKSCWFVSPTISLKFKESLACV